VETTVAIQAFAPVANRQGPGTVTNLTKKQLIGIFLGQITNWQQVGGTNTPIVLINRAKGSGTRARMAAYLFDGSDRFAVGAAEEDNNGTVLQTVAQTPGAISYLGFAYVDDPSIMAFSVDGVKPTYDNVQAEKWLIAGPGYSITKGQPTPLAAAFLKFVLSPSFQNSQTFKTLGYVPVTYAPTASGQSSGQTSTARTNALTAPLGGTALKGVVDIVGTAVHPQFKRWQVELLVDQKDQNTVFIAGGDTAVPSLATLGKLDTTKFPNGYHILRYRVVRTDTNYDEFRVTIVIEN
jgi:hypothetical protein